MHIVQPSLDHLVHLPEARHEICLPRPACAACRGVPDRMPPIQNARYAAHGAPTQSGAKPDGAFLNPHSSRAAASLALVGLTLGLSACSGLSTAPTGAQKVELDGISYRAEQITASTWTATPPAGLPNPTHHRVALVKAIEMASGCKVTDSSFSPLDAALSAQVDCGSRLKN